MDGVVLAAAGTSERFGGAGSKVLRALAGAPVFARALQPLVAALPDCAVVVVARAADHAAIVDFLGGFALGASVSLVEGGATRQKSVARGVAALPSHVTTIVVHDAARPLVTADLVLRVVEAARRDGAAAPTVALADSVHEVGADGRVLRAVPRDALRAVQTPQAARADILRAAIALAERSGLEATDEVGLLLAGGIPVTAVDGDPENLKLTVPSDWRAAEAILARRVS